MSTNIKKIAFDTAVFAYSILISVYWWSGNYAEDTLLIYFAVSCFLGISSHFLKLPTIGHKLFDRSSNSDSAIWLYHLLLLAVGTTLISIEITDATLAELLDPDGIEGAWRLWSGLTHPNFTLLPKAIRLATETIFTAFLATALAVPLAFILAFLCAKNLMRGPARTTTYVVLRGIINLARSIEPLIWALIFTVWVGVGPFAGMLALMFNSIASLTKYYSEILEGVSQGPIDGIRSTGANEVQVIWYGIVPQIILPYIAMTVYRWDTNVRMATVIGLVGGGGIGTLLIQYQGQAMWPEVGCIIFVIASIVWLMDAASAYIRQALR